MSAINFNLKYSSWEEIITCKGDLLQEGADTISLLRGSRIATDVRNRSRMHEVFNTNWSWYATLWHCRSCFLE